MVIYLCPRNEGAGKWRKSCAGILVAVFFSYKGKGLVFVAVAAILASYIVQFMI